MEKELYEQASKVDAKKLSEILNEQEECPFNKTLMDIYGLSTPTSEIIDFIHDQKLSTAYLIIAVSLFVCCIVPAFILDTLFGAFSIGILLMFLMIFFGIFLLLKGSSIARSSSHILNDLDMREEDYNMVQDSYDKYTKQQPTFIALAIGLFIFSFFPMMILEDLFYFLLSESLGIASMFLMIASGIGILLYQLNNKNIFKKLLRANHSHIE